MLLPDWQIAELAVSADMIAPFYFNLIREVDMPCSPGFCPSGDGAKRRVLSYGLSSYGYDLQLSDKAFYSFERPAGKVVSPKSFDAAACLREQQIQEDEEGRYFIVKAHSYALGVVKEKLKMPPNVTGICVGKSTYARLGLICNTTPAEAGWEGHLTIELSNSSDCDMKVFVNEGICQILFFRGEPCRTHYGNREGGPGKYQGQSETVYFSKV